MGDEAAVHATEEWFQRRGLPHFIANYSATNDIWTRALPALMLLFVVEIVVNAPNREFPVWLDIVVIVASLAVLVGGWAIVNRLRHRPGLACPGSVVPFEVAFFVIVPALVPLILGGQVRSALVTLAFNIVLLGAIYVVTSYGLIAMTRWAIGRLGRQLEALTTLMARALPLMALLVTFLFLTTEVWQTAGELHGGTYFLACLLFVVVGVAFVTSRLPRDIGALNHFDGVVEVAELVADTPMCDATPVAEAPPLGRREWGNVGLVALFSQGVQIVLVTVLIFVFYVLLGTLLVSEATTVSWVGSVHVLAHISFGNQELVITEQLLRVAGFLAVFAGLNFSVFLVTDESYRREFRDEVVTELRQSFAVRAVYLESLGAESESSTTMSPT